MEDRALGRFQGLQDYRANTCWFSNTRAGTTEMINDDRLLLPLSLCSSLSVMLWPVYWVIRSAAAAVESPTAQRSKGTKRNLNSAPPPPSQCVSSSTPIPSHPIPSPSPSKFLSSHLIRIRDAGAGGNASSNQMPRTCIRAPSGNESETIC